MKNHKGLSLVELLVCLVVAAIMMLMIGAMASIGSAGHKKVQDIESLYNDLSYGFKVLKNKFRSSKYYVIDATPPSPWIGTRLLLTFPDNSEGAFGLRQINAGTKALVYVPSTTAPAVFDRISTLPTTDDLFLTFTENPRSVTIQISGIKDKARAKPINYDVSNVILRRAP